MTIIKPTISGIIKPIPSGIITDGRITVQPIDPTTLAGLVARYLTEPDTQNTVALGAVAGYNDTIGTSHFLQASGALQPVSQSVTINGQNAHSYTSDIMVAGVDLGGVDFFCDGAGHEFTVFMAGMNPASFTGGYLCRRSATSGNATFAITAAGTTFLTQIRGNNTGLSGSAAGFITLGVPWVLSLRYDGTRYTVRANSRVIVDAVPTGTAVEETLEPVTIGGRTAAAPAQLLAGYYHRELDVYNVARTDAEMTGVEEYLMRQMGV